MTDKSFPSSERVVEALWRAGRGPAAIAYAAAAVARGEKGRDTLARLAGLVRAGAEPPAALAAASDEAILDPVFAERLTDRGRLHEALVLMGALKEGSLSERAQQLRDHLEAALAPLPAGADPSYKALLQLIRGGQAGAAARALAEILREVPNRPAWLVERAAVVQALIQGTWRTARAPVPPATRDTVLQRLRARDLRGAHAAALEAHEAALAAVLRRLLRATEEVFQEASERADVPETVPMDGHRLAEFQIRMGVLGKADRGYRKLLRDDPTDERARMCLADVIEVRQALGEAPDPMPARAPSVGWLNKRAPLAEKRRGWASERPRAPRVEEDNPTEEVTNVLRASDEAELLLKLGQSEQALALYRLLAVRHPRQQDYQNRILEIESLIAQRLDPVAAEPTSHHDLSRLSSRTAPPLPSGSVPPPPMPALVPSQETHPTAPESVSTELHPVDKSSGGRVLVPSIETHPPLEDEPEEWSTLIERNPFARPKKPKG